MYINNLDFNLFLFLFFSFPVFNGLGMFWSVGFLVFIVFFIQVLTGFLYAFNMTAMSLNESGCFFSKLFLFSEICFGWVVVNYHLIAPTFIFFLMFLHVYSIFWFPVFYFLFAWFTGIFIYFLFIIVVFTGYSLVGGYMGFWGIVVISEIFNFVFGSCVSEVVFSSLDVFSDSVVFSIFSYHFFLGIFIIFLLYFHIFLNHNIGSSLSLCSFYINGNNFFTILFINDLYLFFCFFIVFSVTFFFYHYLFFSYDNFLEFSLFYVLEEVVVEWYVSIYFIILKLFSNLFGILLIFLFIFIFIFIYIIKNDLLGFHIFICCFNLILFNLVFYLIFFSYYFYSSYLFISYLFIFINIFILFFFDFILIGMVNIYLYNLF